MITFLMLNDMLNELNATLSFGAYISKEAEKISDPPYNDVLLIHRNIYLS